MSIVFAIATNDKESIVRKHFGDSNYFLIYEFDGENLKKIDEMENIYKDIDETTTHGSKEKRQKIVGTLTEKYKVNYLIAGSNSPNFLKIKQTTNIIPLIAKPETKIDELLDCIKNYRSLDIENSPCFKK